MSSSEHQHEPNLLGAIAGGAYGGSNGGGVTGTAAGVAAGALAPAILGKLIMSKIGRSYLTNQWARNAPSNIMPRVGQIGGPLGYQEMKLLNP